MVGCVVPGGRPERRLGFCPMVTLLKSGGNERRGALICCTHTACRPLGPRVSAGLVLSTRRKHPGGQVFICLNSLLKDESMKGQKS